MPINISKTPSLKFLLTIRNTMLLICILMLGIRTSSQENSNQWPAIEGDGTLRRLYLPILMYHYVSALPPDADDVRIGLTLSPAVFRQHIEYLANASYQAVSLYEMDEALMNGAELPSNPVILTFDD